MLGPALISNDGRRRTGKGERNGGGCTEYYPPSSLVPPPDAPRFHVTDFLGRIPPHRPLQVTNYTLYAADTRPCAGKEYGYAF